ncbi:MAG TPA: hypothetical protein VKA75_07005, partial [Reyranella sp.]|nr:hypothetical protein [Reyranella sp.]
MQLREALDQLATASLRRMAVAHAVAHDDASTRGELVDGVCERLSDPVYLDAQLAALSEVERGALNAAVAAGGEVRGFVLDRDFPHARAGLVERGFLVRAFTASGPRR